MVEGCTRSQIASAFAKSQLATPFRAEWAILTEIETNRLVKWLVASAANNRQPCEGERGE